MKKLLPIATCLILGVSSLSYAQQTPEAFKYQASLRNAQGEIIADKLVSIRVVILSGNNAVYSEVHTISTNQLGLVNFEIGRGTQQLGAFKNISWDASKHFVRIEMDEQGGNDFKTLGTSELLSVPYSLHATMASDVMPGSITIQNEIAARQSADKDLQSQINIVRGMLEQGAKGSGSDVTLGIPQDLEALRNRFMADSVAVRSLITSASSSASSAVLTEKNRAEGIEAGLRTDIDAATATNNSQATAITANETAIAAETARALAAEAALDAKIDNRGGSGILRMTTTDRDNLAAEGGEMIYNTTLNKFQGYQLIDAANFPDQSHDAFWTNIGLNPYGGNHFGQSFTAGATDTLRAIGIYVVQSQGNQNYTLRIYEGEGTGGTLLLESDVEISNNNYYYYNSKDITIPVEGVSLTAGNVYTYTIGSDDYDYRYIAFWYTTNQYNSGYAGGNFYQNGSIWNDYWGGYGDMNFKTYFSTPAQMGWVNMR